MACLALVADEQYVHGNKKQVHMTTNHNNVAFKLLTLVVIDSN
jgi:hypothetical protein